MDKSDPKARWKGFALRIIRLSAALPPSKEGEIIGRQLIRAGTSIGANYRETIRASSRKQFVYSLQVCLREAGETDYWLELVFELEMVSRERLIPLRCEYNELIAILVATIRSSQSRARPTE